MKYTKHMIPEDMYDVKSPYYMNPIGITIHNTPPTHRPAII